ncbi:hypothetical protein [Caballeronia mineralivorans]|uniref:hypothetical protein n=1 Tax=Caballeronia mineralivorans TaxID=2010198 RepID=UPI002AFFD7AC|nr:hypothetical protein [Caballeronia mineralivorans]MEA3097687.1 hypothetical protein [Caballeronia mineralivorans]
MIFPVNVFVSWFVSPVPSRTAPRLVPDPPPPVNVKLPLFAMVLARATLNATGALARDRVAATVESIPMLTALEPATAATGRMPVPVQTTFVPVVGAVELHAALAVPDNASETRTALQMPISSTFFIDLALSGPSMLSKNRLFPLSYQMFYLLSGLPHGERQASLHYERAGFWSSVLETSGRIQLPTVIFAW